MHAKYIVIKEKNLTSTEKMQITDKGMIIKLKMTHHQQLKAEDVEYHQSSIRKKPVIENDACPQQNYLSRTWIKKRIFRQIKSFSPKDLLKEMLKDVLQEGK